MTWSFRLYCPKMLDFPQKLPILVLTKTLWVWLGFTVGFGFFRFSLQMLGSGFGLEKIVGFKFGLDLLHHYYILLKTFIGKLFHEIEISFIQLLILPLQSFHI